MAKKFGVFLYMTTLLSIASLIIIIVAMATPGWIYATATPVLVSDSVDDSDLNYGLFEGSLIRRLVQTPRTYAIYIACAWGSNVCAWSCSSTAALRVAEVEALVAGESPSFACLPDTKMKSDSATDYTRDTNSTTVSSSEFVNAGAWLSTILFLVLLLIAVIGTIVLTAYNSYNSPAEPLLNIQGIYISNGVAAGLNAMVLLIWGIHYGVVTQYNIGIRDTIVGEYTTAESSLGYSYWILMAPIYLHLTNIGLLYIREKLINSEPAETKIDIEDITDGTIVLF